MTEKRKKFVHNWQQICVERLLLNNLDIVCTMLGTDLN